MNKDKTQISLNYDYGNTAKYRNIRLMNKAINHSFKSNEERQKYVDAIPKIEADNFYLTFDKDNNPIYESGTNINRVDEVKAKLLRDIEPMENQWKHTYAYTHNHISFDDYIHGENKKHLFDEAVLQIGNPETNIQKQLASMNSKEKMEFFKDNIEAYKVAYKNATGLEPHIAGITGHADETSFHLHIITSNAYENKNGTPIWKNPISKRDELIKMRQELSLELKQTMELKHPELKTEIEKYEPKLLEKLTPEQYQLEQKMVRQNRIKKTTLQEHKLAIAIQNRELFNDMELKQSLEQKMELVNKPKQQLQHQLERKEMLLNNYPEQRKAFEKAKLEFINIDSEITDNIHNRQVAQQELNETSQKLDEASIFKKKELKIKQQELQEKVAKFNQTIESLREPQKEKLKLRDEALKVVQTTEHYLKESDEKIEAYFDKIDEAKEQLLEMTDNARMRMGQELSIDMEAKPELIQSVEQSLNEFDDNLKENPELKAQELKEQELKQKQEQVLEPDFEPEIN